MKLRTLFLSFLFIGFAIQSFSQDFSLLSKIPLKEKADFAKAEKQVLECANYLTSNPLDLNDTNRKSAEAFLAVWMTGTPDYTFELDESVGKILDSYNLLFGTFLACATKIALENKDKSLNAKEQTNNAISLLMNYCKNPDNKVVLNDTLKKMIEQNSSSNYQKL